jgi:hypothetical protein
MGIKINSRYNRRINKHPYGNVQNNAFGRSLVLNTVKHQNW